MGGDSCGIGGVPYPHGAATRSYQGACLCECVCVCLYKRALFVAEPREQRNAAQAKGLSLVCMCVCMFLYVCYVSARALIL